MSLGVKVWKSSQNEDTKRSAVGSIAWLGVCPQQLLCLGIMEAVKKTKIRNVARNSMPDSLGLLSKCLGKRVITHKRKCDSKARFLGVPALAF